MPDGAAPMTTNPVKPTEIIHVDDPTVACDGGDGALGSSAGVPAHPGPGGDVPVLLAPLHPECGSATTPADIDVRRRRRPDGPPGTKPLHLILIDGSGFIFRAFHALPPMTGRTACR